MRVVVVGNRQLARYVLVHLLENGWNVVGTVSPVGDAAHRQAGFVPVSDLATEHDIELVETRDINDASTREGLEDLEPDLCICPGWHQIIDEEVLSIPEQDFVGFHSSRLPEGRGGAPVNWSLIHGVEAVWISLFRYTTGVDDGPVIAQRAVPVTQRDDVDTIFDRLSLAACDILSEQQEAFKHGTVAATVQPIEQATYRPRRKPQDGLVDWARTATDLFNWVRAQTSPYPGAYTFCEVGKLIIWEASRVAEDDTSAGAPDTPGEIRKVVDGEGLEVETGSTPLRLERVQVEDRPPMWADEFAERYGLGPGDAVGREQAPQGWLYTGIRDERGGTSYETNLVVGNHATLHGVAIVPNGDREIGITAGFGDELLVDESISVSGRSETPIEYAPSSPGTHTLTVTFSDLDSGEMLDRRYLKLFAYDS